MKKIVFTLLLVPMTLVSFAQATPSCTTISVNLRRGMETSSVLALQNFLYAQGFLKPVPNGYFGPGTFAAVKAYQKSLGLSQVGVVGPATRAAIKRDSCIATSPTSSQTSSSVQQAPQTIVSTPPPAASMSTTAPTDVYPVLSSVDLVTLFSGGATDWSFAIHGTFSTTTNTVYFKNTGNQRVYTIGTFSSASGTDIMLPKNLTDTVFSCGSNCSEVLPPGHYEITATTAAGTSNPRTIDIHPFTLSAQTSVVNGPLPAGSTGVKLGTFTFSPSVDARIHAVTFTFSTSTISQNGIGNINLFDGINGGTWKGDIDMTAFQSGIVNAYGDTNNTISGTISGYFTVQVYDYIGKNITTFTSQPILMSVAGVI